MDPNLLHSSDTGILPCWPLMYVMCRFPNVYKYPEFIYNPTRTGWRNYTKPRKHKKHHIKRKGNVPGVAETLEYIECFNPRVYEALLQCGMPYIYAKKIVRKMINSIIM